MANGEVAAAAIPAGANVPWWRLLNRYHWFVLMVAALGWLFDCLDQQLFTLSRGRAMEALLPGVPKSQHAQWGGYATSIFLIGWASGGLLFGMLGDRIGRAKTMMITILVYSLCTGLSALSQTFWDFAFYRFVTGLGVGGEFAVGVALIAEVMPDKARPGALGLLQALSTVGNVSAALIGLGMANLEASGVIGRGNSWRVMFVIGAFPALLALVIRARLKEPERWRAAKEAGAQRKVKLGSYAELFGNQNWHKPAVGAVVCVLAIMITAFAAPQSWPKVRIGAFLAAVAIAFGLWSIYGGPGSRWRRNAVIGLLLACTGVIGLWGIGFFTPELIRSVISKSLAAQGVPAAEIHARVDGWASIGLFILQIGAFCGMLTFSWIAQRFGRRPALALAFITALLSTASTFLFLRELVDFWLIFVMGFFQLAPFAIYAIYLPELFPTSLRSTGTSFCYNVGRFVAASGPAVLGLLTSRVYHEQAEPMRYAGVTMCAIFLFGLCVIPFAAETRDQPLPEEEKGFTH